MTVQEIKGLQAQMSDEVIAMCSTIDGSTFEPITEGTEFANYIQKYFPMGLASIGYLGGHTETRPIEGFPFDERGAKIVEQYLNEMVKKNVVKWKANSDGRLRIERVKTDKGLKTSNPKAVHHIELRLYSAAVVLGQCIAQGLGLKWYDGDGMPGLGDAGTASIFTWHKVRKFCFFGEEDSLVTYYKIIKNRERNDKAVRSIYDQLEAKGVVLPEKRHDQVWYDADGNVSQINVRDRNLKTITIAKVSVANVP